jgi:hypothetical protein
LTTDGGLRHPGCQGHRTRWGAWGRDGRAAFVRGAGTRAHGPRGDRWPVAEKVVEHPSIADRELSLEPTGLPGKDLRNYDRLQNTQGKRHIEYDGHRLVATETRDAASGATVFSIFTLDGAFLFTDTPDFVERHEVCHGEPHGNSWCDGERYVPDAEFIQPGHPAHCPACRRAGQG